MPNSDSSVQTRTQISGRSEGGKVAQTAPLVGILVFAASLTAGTPAQAQIDPGFETIAPERITIAPIRIDPIPRAVITPQYEQLYPIPRTNILPEKLYVKPLEVNRIQMRRLRWKQIVPSDVRKDDVTELPEGVLQEIERGVDVPKGFRSPILQNYTPRPVTSGTSGSTDTIRRQPLGW